MSGQREEQSFKRKHLSNLISDFANTLEQILTSHPESYSKFVYQSMSHHKESDYPLIVHKAVSEYIACAFIDYVAESRHSDKDLHSNPNRINEPAISFIDDLKEYFNRATLTLQGDIEAKDDSTKGQAARTQKTTHQKDYYSISAQHTGASQYPNNSYDLIKFLDAVRRTEPVALAHRVESKKNYYDKGVVTALYDLLNKKKDLEEIGTTLRTVQQPKNQQGRHDSYPRFMEYYDLKKSLIRLA